jgi:hypothetical protein
LPSPDPARGAVLCPLEGMMFYLIAWSLFSRILEFGWRTGDGQDFATFVKIPPEIDRLDSSLDLSCFCFRIAMAFEQSLP